MFSISKMCARQNLIVGPPKLPCHAYDVSVSYMLVARFNVELNRIDHKLENAIETEQPTLKT